MPDLKNIRQIGSPTDTDKIYIENSAYERIHREEFAERRVFVLMGHTECAPGGYTTFVEDVIPVRDIAFLHGMPVWNSHVWNIVFGEVKRSYQNSVIIGWALDIKGMPPRLSAEVEAVHREHFGGAHQLLFLMDTLEREEYFYQNRSGYFYPKPGFYIYFASEAEPRLSEQFSEGGRSQPRGEAAEEVPAQENASGYRADEKPPVTVSGGGTARAVRQGANLRDDGSGEPGKQDSLWGSWGKDHAASRDIKERRRIRENRKNRENRRPEEDLVIIECGEGGDRPRARYREIVYGSGQSSAKDSGKWLSPAAVAAVVILLLAIIGTGIRQGRFSLDGIEQAVESISTKVLPQKEDDAAETSASAVEATNAEDASAILKSLEQSGSDEEILVEEVPQGDVLKE